MSGRVDRYTVKMYYVGKYDKQDLHSTNIATLEDMVGSGSDHNSVK